MEEKNRRRIQRQYIELLLVYFLTIFYLSWNSRSERTIMIMGMPLAISLIVGVLSSFANLCLIIMVVYCKRIGFITAVILLTLQMPLNFIGMIQRHSLSSLPGIFNNLLVIATVIMIYYRNKQIEDFQAAELDNAKERQKVAERLFEQTATSLVNAIDAKDEYSRGHSLRVAEYSKKIAEQLGKNKTECKEIYYAALLHDVGKIGIPDNILCKNGRLTNEEYEVIKNHSVMGKQILSGISEYPYLSIGANFHHERYDGRGYPDKLKGNDIPEIARIISVADAYDAMTSNRSYRDAMPQANVREEIVKGSGTQFDPEIAKVMQYLMDIDQEYQMKEREEVPEFAGRSEMHCRECRDEISDGILIRGEITRIQLKSIPDNGNESGRHIPVMILFDASDGRFHDDEKTIKDLCYLEYAQIGFDGKVEISGARKVKTDVAEHELSGDSRLNKTEETEYSIETVRYKDHVLIKIDDGEKTISITAALPNCAQYAYIALTGEYCTIKDVYIDKTDETIDETYIERIAPLVSYINVPDGDIPNVQIDGYRFDTTAGIRITDGLELRFHTMSLPTAMLVWHCPFINVFTSGDGIVNGRGYREFALVRFDGENWKSDQDDVKNEMTVERTSDFVGWNTWKENNKKGYDCIVRFERKSDRIILTTENFGIHIKNITYLSDDKEVYAALTGDQVALTDIRIGREN